KTIEYAHLPIILNNEGKKMSKRDDASSVKWLLEEGFLPSAISNYLILIGNKAPVELFSVEEALSWFNIDDISKSPARFDLDKLRFINREHLKRMDAKELSTYVGFADEEIGELAKLYLEEAGTLVELRSKIEPIFKTKMVPEEFENQANKLKEVIQNAPYFETYDEFKSYVMKESALKGKDFFKPLRFILTGAEHGPDLTLIYQFLKNYLKEIVK
ncbi:MAG: glutamate--tRNA ligase, partial [Epsilonproteobacteria bacterium]|nr:glutamate--tRNA ligase [Campylobacterota bacterium]